MPKISITQKLETAGEISKIRNEILNQLSDIETFATDRYEFCFHSLKYFAFPALSLDNKESIEDAAKQIVQLIGMEKSALDAMGIQDDARLFDPLNRYMHYFLEFDALPGIEKQTLENLVNDDLKTINAWIFDYETKNSFLVDNEKPRNHGQKTIKDFYDRCKEERKKIIDYLSNGIKERAISRASTYKHLDSVMVMFQDYYDRPYRLPVPGSTRHFNFLNIDLVSHRIGPLPIKEGRELKSLYKTDKKKFYEQVEKKLPATKLLNYLNLTIKRLPIINAKRIDVFAELTDLYTTKKYLGFYALGVPQIEGLFLDMCKLCMPNFNNPQAALPDKVNSLRPFYKGSESIMDYFQYHVPNQRNSFLHYGTQDKEDIEILCKDLLFDLVEVLEIFEALDTDALWLNRLIKKRDVKEFATIGSFSFYFELVAEVKKKKQYNYFEQDIKALKLDFFPDLILNVTKDLRNVLENLKEKINHVFSNIPFEGGLVVNLNSISNQQIADNANIIFRKLQEYTNWQLKEEIKEVLETQDFFKSYKLNLDLSTLGPGLEKEIDSISGQFHDFLCKIKQISLITEFEK